MLNSKCPFILWNTLNIQLSCIFPYWRHLYPDTPDVLIETLPWLYYSLNDMPLDGHSYLVAQGWGGKGTGLREGAISRPLAIAQKKNLAGLGKDRDEAFPFWDQWVRCDIEFFYVNKSLTVFFSQLVQCCCKIYRCKMLKWRRGRERRGIGKYSFRIASISLSYLYSVFQWSCVEKNFDGHPLYPSSCWRNSCHLWYRHSRWICSSSVLDGTCQTRCRAAGSIL